MNKVYSRAEVLEKFADGQRIMIGGFASVGVPTNLIDGLIETGVKNLTVIANDTGFAGEGVGKIFSCRQGSKLICSYVGLNPEAQKIVNEQVNSGLIELELNPQGTLAERIRSGGTGLGGVLVQAGLGTIIEQGKQKIVVDGKTYLLETPLHADIALIKAWKADTYGNLVYRRTAQNFNPLMAMAGKLVIVEAEEIVPIGTIDPDDVMTPGVFVNMILAK